MSSFYFDVEYRGDIVSKNKFDVRDDRVYISHEKWNFIAVASIKDEYLEELMSVTWTKNNGYLYSKQLSTYLHIYVMKKWYGEEKYEQMKAEGYVVDHMDNNGYNCCINNLCFLIEDENVAKGRTVDKMSKEKSHIALTLYKDFDTELIQIAVFFNYPAIAKIEGLEKPAVIDLAHLLYDAEYEIVLNDTRSILYDYRRDFSFAPEMLHYVDYHIEGCYGKPVPVELYNSYIAGGHGHRVVIIKRIAPISNWTLDDKREIFYIRG